MATDPRRSLGVLGEDEASRRIRGDGGFLIARNVRTRHGEIDLIAIDRSDLCFIEVKTLSTGNRAGPERPALAVTPSKCRRLRSLAAAWLTEAGRLPRFAGIRFDVIGVRVDQAGRVVDYEHLRNAF